DARKDVRVAHVFRGQAHRDGCAHRAVRPASRAGCRSVAVARRRGRVARYPRRHGDSVGGTLRRRHEHDQQRRADRARLRAHRRAFARARREDHASGRHEVVSLDVPREDVADLARLGVIAFTTTRDAGTFGTAGREPVGDVMGRWWSLVEALHEYSPRLATSRQVHGTRVLVHRLTWDGWLRSDGADGHVAPEQGTALAITVAD